MKSINEHIIDCNPQSNYKVWIKFYDGLEEIVDLSVFKDMPAFKDAWRKPEDFLKVKVGPFTHTLTWGNSENIVDVNPAELRRWVLDKISDER